MVPVWRISWRRSGLGSAWYCLERAMSLVMLPLMLPVDAAARRCTSGFWRVGILMFN
jgi:hypothetical protein